MKLLKWEIHFDPQKHYFKNRLFSKIISKEYLFKLILKENYFSRYLCNCWNEKRIGGLDHKIEKREIRDFLEKPWFSPLIALFFILYREPQRNATPKLPFSVLNMEIRVLSFPSDNPPLPVIVAAKLAGFSLPTDTSLPPNSTPTLLFSNGYLFILIKISFLSKSLSF